VPFLPGKAAGIDHPGGAVNPQRLEAGGGIGTLLLTIQPVNVQRAGLDPFQDSLVVSPAFLRKGRQPLTGRKETDRDLLRQRRIYKEAAPAVPQERGSQPDSVCHARDPFPRRR
jgi:hypothetical protein